MAKSFKKYLEIAANFWIVKLDGLITVLTVSYLSYINPCERSD